MVLNIYAIFDRLAGSYGEPYLSQNDAIAMRRFQYLMTNAPMVQSDCELYLLGSYNPDTGLLVPLERPSFVGRFVNEVKS